MITETEFKAIVKATLGTYMTERGSFGKFDRPNGYHFDYCGWGVSVDSDGLWEFSTGKGFHGEGRSLLEAIQNEESRT